MNEYASSSFKEEGSSTRTDDHHHHQSSSSVVEELSSTYVEHGSLIQHLENNSQRLQSKALQLCGAYLIFIAILYTLQPPAAAAAAAGSHHMRWPPLSVLVFLWGWVSIAFWMVFMSTMRECLKMKRLKEVNCLEQNRVYRRIRSIQQTSSSKNQLLQQQQLEDDEGLVRVLARVRRRSYGYVYTLTAALLFSSLSVSYSLFFLS